MKRTVIALACLLALLLTACGREAPAPTDVPETTAEPTAVRETLPRPADAGDLALFDLLLVPAAEGELSLELQAFEDRAAAYGFRYVEEAGVLLLKDPAWEDCFLRGEDIREEKGVWTIGALVYSRTIDTVQRQVRVSGLDTGTPECRMGVSYYDAGTEAASLGDLRAYLSGELTAEETAPVDTSAALGLYENILLPLAEGTIPNNAASLAAALDQQGYLHVLSAEGTVSIIDPACPECRLFVPNALLSEDETIASIGFYGTLEDREVGASVVLCNGAPEYYIQDVSGKAPVRVDTLEEITAYLREG